jgi:hypothetical protein
MTLQSLWETRLRIPRQLEQSLSAHNQLAD